MIRDVNVVMALARMLRCEATEAVHVEVGDDGIERDRWILDEVSGAAGPLFFRSGVQKDDGAAWDVSGIAGSGEGVGHLDETDGARAIVGGAIEYLVALSLRIATEVIMMRRDDDVLLAQCRIRARQNGDHVLGFDHGVSLEFCGS